MTLLRYKKTLDIVEKFMISSRIREYCTDICKGKCCRECYKENKKAGHRQEGRRLSCSIYLCASLYNLFSKKNTKILMKVKSIVIKEYYTDYAGNNIYFNVPSKKFFKQSRFSSDVIYKLDDNMAKEINIIMTKAITYKKIYETFGGINARQKIWRNNKRLANT